MSDERSFLEATRRITADLIVVSDYFNKEYTTKLMVDWKMEEQRNALNDVIKAKEMEIRNKDNVKLEIEMALKEKSVKLKEMEDNAYKKLSEVNAQVVIKRSELERLNAEVYRVSNILKQKESV